MPLVSVIIPSFNYAGFIEETIDSVLAQSEKDLECLVIDDGSTDNTAEVVNKIAERDNRVIYHYQENQGLAASRNKGLSLAKGDYIQFLDSDDIIHPEKLEKQISEFKGNPELMVSHSNFEFFLDSVDNIIEKKASRRSKLKANALEDFLFNWNGDDLIIPIHTALISRSFINAHSISFNTELKAKEDWHFWIQLAIAGAAFSYIDHSFAFYRKHSNSMVHNPVFMSENFTKAALLIDQIIPEEYHIQFRQTCAKVVSTEIKQIEDRIAKVYNSKQYRLGNIFIKPYLKIKRLING